MAQIADSARLRAMPAARSGRTQIVPLDLEASPGSTALGLVKGSPWARCQAVVVPEDQDLCLYVLRRRRVLSLTPGRAANLEADDLAVGGTAGRTLPGYECRQVRYKTG